MDTYDLKKLLFELHLTPDQAAFCESYAIDGNPDKAILATNYKSKGRFAKQMIHDLMTNERCLQYIKALRDNAFLRADISLDDVVNEYKKVAFTNMADYVDFGPGGIIIKCKESLTEAQQAGIMEITETETKLGKTVTLKLHPKLNALDKLYKMMTEMDDRLKEKQPKGDGKLQINAKNVRVVLADPKMRLAIENLAGAFLKHDLKISEPIRKAITDLTTQNNQEEITDAMAEAIEAERYEGSDETRGLLLKHDGDA